MSALSCAARLILAILLSLRYSVQIEIETLFPRLVHIRFKRLGAAGNNLPRLLDHPIVEIRHANRSLLWARFSQLRHQTSAVCPGHYRLRWNSAHPFLAPVRVSLHSDKLRRGQASLWRVVRNRRSRFDLCHSVRGRAGHRADTTAPETRVWVWHVRREQPLSTGSIRGSPRTHDHQRPQHRARALGGAISKYRSENVYVWCARAGQTGSASW